MDFFVSRHTKMRVCVMYYLDLYVYLQADIGTCLLVLYVWCRLMDLFVSRHDKMTVDIV